MNNESDLDHQAGFLQGCTGRSLDECREVLNSTDGDVDQACSLLLSTEAPDVNAAAPAGEPIGAASDVIDAAPQAPTFLPSVGEAIWVWWPIDGVWRSGVVSMELEDSRERIVVYDTDQVPHSEDLDAETWVRKEGDLPPPTPLQVDRLPEQPKKKKRRKQQPPQHARQPQRPPHNLAPPPESPPLPHPRQETPPSPPQSTWYAAGAGCQAQRRDDIGWGCVRGLDVAAVRKWLLSADVRNARGWQDYGTAQGSRGMRQRKLLNMLNRSQPHHDAVERHLTESLDQTTGGFKAMLDLPDCIAVGLDEQLRTVFGDVLGGRDDGDLVLGYGQLTAMGAGNSITKHVDSPKYGDVIVTVGLLGEAQVTLREKRRSNADSTVDGCTK